MQQHQAVTRWYCCIYISLNSYILISSLCMFDGKHVEYQWAWIKAKKQKVTTLWLFRTVPTVVTFFGFYCRTPYTSWILTYCTLFGVFFFFPRSLRSPCLCCLHETTEEMCSNLFFHSKRLLRKLKVFFFNMKSHFCVFFVFIESYF